MTGSTLSQRPQGRVGILDELRGLDLLAMIVYHGIYDLVYLFGVPLPAFHGPAFRIFQLAICSVFILISGACCQYSRSNLRRGLQTFGVALVMSLVTIVFLPEQAIWFGILHFMGAAMVLYGLTARLWRRLPPIAGIPLSLLLYFATRGILQGKIGLGPLSFPLPTTLYTTRWLFPFGIMGPGFYSADYFPLLPWFFLFLAGSYIGALFQNGQMPRMLYPTRIPLLAAIGKHSLLIYVLHQPVLFGVLTLWFRFLAP